MPSRSDPYPYALPRSIGLESELVLWQANTHAVEYEQQKIAKAMGESGVR